MVPVTMHFCFSKRILQQAEGQGTAAAKCFLLCGAARGDAAVRIGCRCNFNPATALPDFPTACRVRSRDAIRVDCSNHSGSSASGETGLETQNAEPGLLKSDLHKRTLPETPAQGIPAHALIWSFTQPRHHRALQIRKIKSVCANENQIL